MFRKTVLAASMLFALAGSAQATSSFTFDTNGSAAGGQITGVTTFDWLPGNALAVGGNPTGGLQTGNTVQLLYQANLGVLTDGSVPLYANNGAGGFFFTAVAVFNETATVTGGGINSTFTMAPGTSLFRIYATPALGNNLAGTGFTTGTVILSGTLTGITSSNFTVTTDPITHLPVPTQTFDQFGTNNYVGTSTIVGSGSTDLVWKISSWDAAFFPTLSLGMNLITAINSSLVDPFQQVDPSRLFSSNAIANGDLASNIGTCNGCFHSTGPNLNFQFQADANSSLQTVPEPGSLALLGIALGGLGALSLRRSRTAA